MHSSRQLLGKTIILQLAFQVRLNCTNKLIAIHTSSQNLPLTLDASAT
jgi:hypothetical protein